MTLLARIQKRLSPRFAVDVDLTLPAGISILFGASGSGKSTILRCLAGLTRPDAGRIVSGDRILFDSASGIDVSVQQRRTGYVFQQLALFPHLSVEENIRYGLQGLAMPAKQRRVHAIAESFRITDILGRRPSQTSGGERQRTALARALVTEPSLLLLDEPLSALDQAIQLRILGDLRRWNDEHRIPIVYVTHSHREVFALGAQVIVMDAGRVLATGSPHEVLDQPVHHVLANLAGFENVFEATVVDRRDRAGTMQCRLEGSMTELEVAMTGAQIGETVHVAIRAGDILLANHEAHGLSARNVVRGQLSALVEQGATIVAWVDAGPRFIVHVTRSAIEAIGVHVGDDVWLVIKSFSCRIST